MGQELNKLAAKIHFLVICLCVLAYVPVFSQTYPVGSTDVVWVDSARTNRAVTLHLYYPAQVAGPAATPAPGTFPCVVFGHGFAMGYTAYQNIWEAYVPLGFVVAMVDMENGFSPDHSAFGYDIAFAGQRFAQACLQDPSFLLYQKHNGRVAFAGHSMGAGAAVLAASYVPDFPDALLLLAPAETNPSAVAAAPAVQAPAMVFSGSADAVTPPLEHHRPIFDALGSVCKHFVNIEGGAHCYFANTNLACDFGETAAGTQAGISRAEQQALTKSVGVPFFQVYLKNEFLQQAELTAALQQPGIDAEVNCDLHLGVQNATVVLPILYPNPSNGYVVLENLPGSVNGVGVTSVTGQKWNFPIFESNVQLLELPNGFYVLQAGPYRFRLLLQR